jgi:nucleoside-diphosphate-sugar epimerase
MPKVVVTGGSGRLGQHAISHLLEHGYEALSLDIVPPREPLCDSWLCDLRRSGDLYEAFRGADAVIHLGAYQAPNLAPDSETFSNNVTATYNVLKAAVDLGVPRVVCASSIAAYGFLYAPKIWTPDYLPLDEAYPCRPQDPYALSKVFGEQLADSCTRYSDITVVSLRFSGVNFDPTYGELPRRWADPGLRMGTFWSYVDARDAAVAFRLALEGPLSGHEVFNIAAPTSRYPEPTDELVRRFIPDTKIKEGYSGHWGGLDVTKAAEMLGFKAAHVWRNYLDPDGTPKTPASAGQGPG